MLKYRNNTLSIKDVDLSKRTVTGYFAAFDSEDSDSDIIVKGAFSKTISENSSRIAHLLQHNISQPIGKIKRLEEDSTGLKFESVLSNSTLGNDTLIQYQEGILREHSIGFNTVKGEGRKDYYEIQEVKLWEGSTVTFGANPNTPVLGIKSEIERTETIYKRVQALDNFMRKGSQSDESWRLLEFELKQLQNILSLKLKEPPKHSKEDEPIFDFDRFLNHLK